MEKTLEILNKSLSDVHKRERKHKTVMFLLCLGVSLCGVGLIISVKFWVSGIVAILMGIILYLKIYQVSTDRIRKYEEMINYIKNEPKS